MILLIPNSSSEYSAPSLPFKFHYDSINSEKTPVVSDLLKNLNSIMILLIPQMELLPFRQLYI